MTIDRISDTKVQMTVGDRKILLIGTAHVSKQSIEEVESAILEEKPDRVCVEIDSGRYASMQKENSWENMNLGQVMRQGKGFLLLANLVLSSFQRRLGKDLGVNQGAEMMAAVKTAKENNIPFSFCDRQVQTTLRRAWVKSNFWNKNKMLAALVSSIISSEKLSEDEIERLKQKSALQDMMEELAQYLPSVKEVLIDERDRFLATKIFEAQGTKILAVVGAGHMEGIIQLISRLESRDVSTDLSSIDVVPPPGIFSKIIPWVIPAVVIGLFVAGFFRSGWQTALEMLWMWVLVNGSLSALGSLIAMAHPVSIIVSFLVAPLTSINPFMGVGIIAGLTESYLRKPRVLDFENLHDDIVNIKGFYRNRFTHALVVFFLSSVGSIIGTFIGFPFLTSLLTG